MGKQYRTVEGELSGTVNTVVNLDMQLVVGSVDQAIEVTSAAPLLETTGTNLGRIMAAEVIQDLPLTTGGGLRSTTAFIMLTRSMASFFA